MKAKYSFIVLSVVAIFFAIQSCEMTPDPGFDGIISGIVTDASNAPVYSDILTNNIIVNALGKGDLSPTVIRVDGKGNYSYSKLFPKEFKIYLKGPVYVISPDTARLDFSAGNTIVQNFVVEPYLSVKIQLEGAPTDTTVSVSYSVVGNRGKVPSTREIYCCTSPFPTKAIGSSAYYSTITSSQKTDVGTTKITGLKWGTKYYIRMGANGKTGSTNDLMNYSEQIIVQIPDKKF